MSAIHSRLSSFALLAVSAFAMFPPSATAQKLQYSSQRRDGQQTLPQSINTKIEAGRALASGSRQSVSIAVGDFDQDGSADLVTGYATPTGGAFTLQRGVTDGLPAGDATAFTLPVRPDFLQAVDINGDGVMDVVVAARGSNTIYVVQGDGRGGFLAPAPMTVGGALSGLGSWRNKEGSNFLVAASCGTKCHLEVFGTDGTPVADLALPAAVSAMEVAALRPHGQSDVVLAAGGKVYVVTGNSLSSGFPVLEALPVSNASALLTGSFVYDRRGFTQIAVMDSASVLHILGRTGLDSSAVTHEQAVAQRARGYVAPPLADPNGLAWTEIETISSLGSLDTSAGVQMIKAHTNTAGGEDILIFAGSQAVTVQHFIDSDGTLVTSDPRVIVDSTATPVVAAVAGHFSQDARDSVLAVNGGVQPVANTPPTLPTVNKTWTVTTTTDSSDSLATPNRCVSGSGVTCSLRDAILLSNNDSASNRSGNKIDTVSIPAGTYTLTLNPALNTYGDATNHVEITGPINIVGAGSASTIIDGQALDKIFSINSPYAAATYTQVPFLTFISGVKLQNGKNINLNGSNWYGGALDWDSDGSGYLTMTNSIIQNNVDASGSGGGIAAFSATNAGVGTVELDGSTVTGNNSSEQGGGLYVTTGVPLVLNNTAVTNNQAKPSLYPADPNGLGQGGGIFTFDSGNGKIVMNAGTTVTGNSSDSDGGGIYTISGFTFTGVASSAVAGSTTTGFLNNTSGRNGGGIFVNTTSETSNVTLASIRGNSAVKGGGVYVGPQTNANNFTMQFSRIVGNTASSAGAGIEVGNSTTGGVANVTDNWWGCNTPAPPSGTNCNSAVNAGGTLNITPFTVASITVAGGTPTPVVNPTGGVAPTGPTLLYSAGGTITGTGDLDHDSAGTAYSAANVIPEAGLANTVTVVAAPGTATSTTVLSTLAADSVSQAENIPGAGTANFVVDGFTITEPFTITAPDMTVASTHVGNFRSGSTGNVYTLTATNSGNAASSGTITVVDTLPTGFTATAMSGTNWTCTVGTLTCTYSLAVAAATALPAISLTVSVSSADAGTYSNSVAVSGGNEYVTTNDTGTDSTIVVTPMTTAAAFSPTSMAINGTSALTFSLTNPAANTIALTGAAFTVTLPSGLVVNTPNGLANTCGGTATAVAGSGSISLSGGTIAINTTCTLSLNVTSAAGATYVVTSSAVTSTNSDNGPAMSATLIVLAPPTNTLAFGASTIPLNGSTSLTFTVTNPNATTGLAGVTFTDTLPAGLVVATPNGLTNTCSGTVTATAGSGSISLGASTISGGANCVITVNVTGTTAGTKTTTAPPSATSVGTGTSNSPSVVVVAPATISISPGATTIQLNGSTSITYTVTNPNAATSLTGLAFTLTLPSGMVVSTPNGLTGSCGGGTITATAASGSISLSGATLAASTSCTFSNNVTGTSVGAKSVTTGAVSSTQGGTGSGSNTSTITVIGGPTTTMAFGAASVPLNGTTSLTLTLTNPNTTSLSSVGFSDTLPAGLVVATPNGLANTCGGTVTATAASGSISLAGGSMAGSATCTVTVNVTGTTVGTKTNTVAAPTSTEGGSTGSGASSSLIVAAAPSISGAFGASSVALNGSTSLTFTITNPNATIALSGLAFTNTLPAGLVVTTPNGLTNTCGGTATAVAASGSISLSGGSVAISASCTVTVNVTGTTVGTKNNSESVTSTEGGTGNTSNQSLTVVGPPVIIKAFGAASIPLNGSTSLTFTIQNNNTGISLTGIGFTDSLPAGLVVSTPNGLTGSCGGGTITSVAGSSSISLSGSTLAASTSCTFAVNVTGTTAGTKSNTTGNVTSTEGGTGGTASASVNVVAAPSMAAAFGASSVAVNGSTSLTYTITNPAANAVSLTGVAFSTTLPAGLVVTTPNGLSSTCGGTATAVAASTAISLTGGTISSGSSCTVTVNVTGTAAGSYTVTSGTVSSTNGGTGNTASASLTVASAPSISGAFGSSSIAINGTTSLTYTITNPNASLTLNGISFTNNLPAGLVVATPNGATNTCSGAVTATAASGSIALASSTLAGGASCTITVNVTGTTAGTKNNSESITSTEGGAGNTSNQSVVVVGPPVIIKAFGASSIPLNGSTSLTFTIQNNNAGTSLTGIGFTDSLPAGLVVSTPNGLTGSCGGGTITSTAGSGSISLSGSTLAASTSCTFAVNVTGTTAGTKSNTTGNVTSTEGGSGGTASASVTVIAPPTIGAAVGATPIVVGNSTSLTFTLTNPNVSTLTGAAFSVTLPTGLLVSTPSSLSNTCGGTATAVAGSTAISLSGGSIAGTGSCTVALNIKGNVIGVYTVTTGSVSSTNGGTGTSASVGITVNGAASKLGFSTAPATPITAGGNAGTVAVQVQDASSVVVSGDNTDVVTLTVTGPGAYSQTYNATASSGVATFNLSAVTLTVSGTYTYTATSGALTQAQVTEAVNAAAAASLKLTGSTGFTSPNQQGSVTVTALDTYNNVATSFTGTVHFTSSDAGASLPADYTFVSGDQGAHVFTFFLVTAGTQTVTATSGALSGTLSGIFVQDSVWIVNANGTLARLTDAGVPSFAAGSAGTAGFRGGLAFDNVGSVWSVISSTNSVFFTSRTGISGGPFTGGGVNAPVAIAVDGLGQVWVANGNNSVTVLSNSGAAVSPAAGYVPGTINGATGIAVDNSGSVWVTSATDNTVTKIIGGAAPSAAPISAGTVNNTLGARP